MTSFSEAYDDLEEFMVGDDIEPPGTEEQVERMLRGVAYRRRKIQQAKELVAAEKERLDEYLAQVAHRFDCSYFEDCLSNYHAARLSDDPKAKTLRFPSGELTARVSQPAWEIDPEVFVPWAEVNAPLLLRTKVEVDRSAVKSALHVSDGRAATTDGEIVPGVAVEDQPVAFKVKAGPS